MFLLFQDADGDSVQGPRSTMNDNLQQQDHYGRGSQSHWNRGRGHQSSDCSG